MTFCGLSETVKRAKGTNVLTESAKGHLGSSGRQSKIPSEANCLKRGFALCKRLFWKSRLGAPKTFRTLVKHFKAFWLFRHLHLAAESQDVYVQMTDSNMISRYTLCSSFVPFFSHLYLVPSFLAILPSIVSSPIPPPF